MSSSSLRVIAAGIAAIVAVLTGIVAGLVEARTGTCVQQVRDMPAEQPPGQGIEKPDGAEAGPNPTVVGQSGDCDSSFSVVAAGIGFTGAAVAGGVAVAFLLVGGRSPRTAGPAGNGLPVAPVSGAGSDPGLTQRLEQAEAERQTLVQTCVYVRDRATSRAIADTLGRALQEVGVNTVAPVGVRFDPAHHEAGGATAAADPTQVGTIAAVEVPGYIDRGVALRAPVVTVYREEGGK